MYYGTHPEFLRLIVDERHETLRRAAVIARLRREARAKRREHRRDRRRVRTRRAEDQPHLVARPPALAE